MHGQIPEGIIDQLSELKPDIIALPGDIIECINDQEQKDKEDNSFSSRIVCSLMSFFHSFLDFLGIKRKRIKKNKSYSFLKKISQIAPVVMSLGNHESFLSINDLEAIEKANVILLNNKITEIQGIKFGGINSKQFTGKLNTQFLEKFEKEPGYKILLCHHPEYYDEIKNYDIDLILSGHAHGGQIKLFDRGLFAPGQGFFPKYYHGMHEKMIITSGASNNSFLPRLFNPCELVMVELKTEITNIAEKVTNFFNGIPKLNLDENTIQNYISIIEQTANLWKKHLNNAPLRIKHSKNPRYYVFTIEQIGQRLNPFQSKNKTLLDSKENISKSKTNVGYELRFSYSHKTNRLTLRIPNIKAQEKVFAKNLIILMIPLAIQSLLQNVASTVDTLMLGSFSKISMNGCALATSFLNIQTTVLLALGVAQCAMTSRFLSQKNGGYVKKVYKLSLLMSAITALVFFILEFFTPSFVMSFYSNNTDIIGEGVSYLRIIAFAYSIKCFSLIQSRHLTVMGKERTVTIGAFVSNGLNILLNFVLIFGWFGITPLGIKGAAIATLISAVVEAIINFVIIRKPDTSGLVSTKNTNPSGLKLEFFKRFILCNIQMVGYMVGINLIASAFGHLDSTILAVFSVISTVGGWLCASRDGLQDSATIMISRLLGKSKFDKAYNMSNVCVEVGAQIGLIYSLIFAILTCIFSYGYIGKDGISIKLFLVFLIISTINLYFGMLTTVVQGSSLIPGGDLVYSIIIDSGFTVIIALPLLIFSNQIAALSVPLLIILLKSDEIIKYPFFKFRRYTKKWLKS